LKIGLKLPAGDVARPQTRQLVERAEALGMDSVWAGESYGRDAVSALGYLAATTSSIGLGSAVLQIDARTPAMTAMAAASLDEMSGGRLRLGLGVSGPQVVEGWHGMPFERPLARSREYVELVRAILAREAPVQCDGEFFQLPRRGPGTSGVGKPLRLAFEPVRPAVPILLAAIGPRNVALAVEIADGWMPIFFAPRHSGMMAAGVPPGFEVVTGTVVASGASLAQARDRVRPRLAQYIGGMGAPGRNFYFDLVCRYGYTTAAERIQRLFQAGDRAAAVAAVPDDLVDDTMLVGPPGHLREQLAQWQASAVSTLILSVSEPDELDLICSLL
jgi:F420-dependent oxidoreductase-like protein